MKTNLLMWFMLLFVASLASAQQPDAAIAKELKAYYEKGNAPPWAEAIKNLTANNPKQRDGAAKYLVALLDQAQADELSGKAPWRATPFWVAVAKTLRGTFAR